MRYLAAFLLLLPASASARAISVTGNTIHLPVAATAKVPDVWADAERLVLILPSKRAINQTVRPEHRLIKEVSIQGVAGAARLTITLAEPAERYLSKVVFGSSQRRMTVSIDSPPAAVVPATASVNRPKVQAKPAPPQPARQQPVFQAVVTRASRDSSQRSSVTVAGAVFAVCILGAVFWWRRKRRKDPFGFGSTPSIEVLQQHRLGGKHRLVVVRCGGETMLLGCTENHVRLLRSGVADAGQVLLAEQHEHDLAQSGVEVADDDIVGEEDVSFAPVGPNKETTQALVDQLSAQIAARHRGQDAGDDNSPLDARWAAGILKMRRERQAQQSASSPVVH